MSNHSKAERLRKKTRQESRKLAAEAKAAAANVMDLTSRAKEALASAAQTLTAEVGASRAKSKNGVDNLKH